VAIATMPEPGGVGGTDGAKVMSCIYVQQVSALLVGAQQIIMSAG